MNKKIASEIAIGVIIVISIFFGGSMLIINDKTKNAAPLVINLESDTYQAKKDLQNSSEVIEGDVNNLNDKKNRDYVIMENDESLFYKNDKLKLEFSYPNKFKEENVCINGDYYNDYDKAIYIDIQTNCPPADPPGILNWHKIVGISVHELFGEFEEFAKKISKGEDNGSETNFLKGELIKFNNLEGYKLSCPPIASEDVEGMPSLCSDLWLIKINQNVIYIHGTNESVQPILNSIGYKE